MNIKTSFVEGDYQFIIDSLQKPTTSTDYYWKAKAYAELVQYKEAINTLTAGLVLFPENNDLERMLGLSYYQTGQYQKAQLILEKYTEDTEIFNTLISIYDFKNQHQRAIEILKPKFEIDTLNTNIINSLADQYYKVKNNVAAIYYFEKSHAIQPSDQVNSYQLANLYFKNGRYAECAQICDTFLAQDSTNIRFIKLKGMAAFNSEHFQAAKNYFEQLIVLNDTSFFNYKHLGVAKYKLGDFLTANKDLQQAYDKDTNDYETCFFLGSSYYHTTTPQKGLYYLKRVENLVTPKPELISAIYLEKQYIYDVLEEYDLMISSYKKSYALTQNPRVLFSMGSAYQYKIENNDSALVYYSRFLNQLPDSTTTEKENVVSLKKVAQQRIAEIRETAFFEGTLDKN